MKVNGFRALQGNRPRLIGAGGLGDLCIRNQGQRARTSGFTLVEVVIAAVILGVMTMALCACLWSGFGLIQSSRENLRATQIMLQRTEAIRLFNWNQITDTNYLKPTFTEYYDPQSSNSLGVSYNGFVTAAVPTNLPAAYRNNSRLITLSLYWTNVSKFTRVVRSRQMQTQVARYGMQNYVWGTQ